MKFMMLSEHTIENNTDLKSLTNEFKTNWKNLEKKVFYFKSNKNFEDVRNYYFNLFKTVGKFFKVAEDARITDRNKQKTQTIWMEVRFDSSIKNAYRHSANAQPLHTDGSYNPNYPNSTLMCCEFNNAENGETIFIDAKKVADILKDTNLELFNKIKNFEIIHERSGDLKKSPILSENQNKIWNINWNYYCVSKNLTKNENEIKEQFQNFLLGNHKIKENLLQIKMNKGDAIIWKDNEVLHGRNSFIAKKNSDRFIWKCAVNF